MDAAPRGGGHTATTVANNVLRLARRDGVEVTPMKLQKILYFLACLYQRRTGSRLLAESFQAWRYGPVVRSVYDEFKSFGGSPITRYATDADGVAWGIDEQAHPEFADALDEVWNHTKGRGAVDLSRITHAEGSAWWKAWKSYSPLIDDADMASDVTFLGPLGMAVA